MKKTSVRVGSEDRWGRQREGVCAVQLQRVSLLDLLPAGATVIGKERHVAIHTQKRKAKEIRGGCRRIVSVRTNASSCP